MNQPIIPARMDLAALQINAQQMKEKRPPGRPKKQHAEAWREVKALHLDRYQARALLAVLADAVR